MVNETLARRYATAIFSLARDRHVEERVGNDLARIAAAIEGDALAQRFFVAPIIARQEKERVLLAAFSGKVNDVALHALLLLVRKRRESLLGAIVAEYRKLQLDARGAEVLTITSARPLDAGELRALVDRLQHVYGKSFDTKQVVDPNVIGGVRILMGDRRIDATVSGRLESLARTLYAGD